MSLARGIVGTDDVKFSQMSAVPGTGVVMVRFMDRVVVVVAVDRYPGYVEMEPTGSTQ